MRNTFLLVCLFASAHLNAQKKDEQTKADKIYEQLGYAEAIELYRQGKLDMASMERMAHGYRLNHDTYNAERWYAQFVEDSDDPLNLLHYAQACHSNGNYAKAKEFYLKYNQATGGSDQRGERLAQALDRQAEFRSKKAIVVRNATALNSNKLDFSPALFENGVVFASTRAPEEAHKKQPYEKDTWTGDDFTNLYFAYENADGSFGKTEVFAANLGTEFHEGPLTFSRSGDQIFFTRTHVKSDGGLRKQKGKVRTELKLKIYAAYRRGDGWDTAEPLDLGDANANDAHPSLAPDGQKLYFASDRAGGFGGMDLYVSHFSGGIWSAPLNLGSQINTPGNEVFPFAYDDGTLYFASDGWGGLGGLDLFFSETKGENAWCSAANLGSPFNSPKDDFGYVLNFSGTDGYFTSAREGGTGKDDIYSFSLPEPQSNKTTASGTGNFFTICATDASTGERLNGVKINVLEELQDGGYQGFEEDYVMRLVPTGVEGEFSLSQKRRDPFAHQNTETETYTTVANGAFQVQLDPAKQYLFIAKKAGYQQATETLVFANQDETTREFCIPLNPSNCLTLSGKVLNKRYGNLIPGATVTLMNLCTGDLTTVKSDAAGNYHFACLPCECDFIVQGSKANFKQDNNLASTVDMDCVATNETLEKDLQLMPDPGAMGTPGVVSYKPDAGNNSPGNNRPGGKLNEKPGWENDPKGAGFHPRPYGIEHPIEDYLDDPTAFDRAFEEGLTIELENIYYDFDKSDIRPDAAIELDKVAALMHRYPDLLVELRSHTDSRAEDAYNQALSQRRAVEVLRYLVRNGISGSRIKVKGYGESWLVNECENGVPCPETDHQMNRRTEIKVFRR